MASSWFAEVVKAWNDHDAEAVAAHLANDVIYEDVAMGRVMRGPAEVADFVRETEDMASDFRMDVVDMFEDGEHYAAEWLWAGTHTGEVAGIPATGRPFLVRGVSVGQRTANKVTKNRDYWNIAEFLSQIGMLPAAGSQPA